MTVTDEDIDLFLSVNNIWPDSETAAHVRKNRAFSWEVQQIAKYRQAAYAAGLERAANHDAAAKVLYQYACNMAVGLARAGDLEGYKESLWFKMANAIADAMPDAIRAEKDKT